MAYDSLKNDPSKFIEHNIFRFKGDYKPEYRYIIDSFHKSHSIVGKMRRGDCKSFLGNVYALYYALYNKNVNVVIVTENISTGKSFRRQMDDWILHLPRSCEPQVANHNQIMFKNGSKILFHTYSNLSQFVGLGNVKLMVLDEFGLVERDKASSFLSQCAPLIAWCNTKVLCLSTDPRDIFHSFNWLFDSTQGIAINFKPIVIASKL